MGNFPVIDLIFLILIILMLIHGYAKGFVEELFSWATFVLAMLAAVFFYAPGAVIIRKRVMEDVKYVPEILAFIAVFFIVMIFLKMLERVLKDIIMGAHLGGINKVIGAVFGLVEGFALTAIILFILTIQPVFDASKIIGDSIFAQILLPIIKAPLSKGREIITAVHLFFQASGNFLV